jgi:hypothetical protein
LHWPKHGVQLGPKPNATMIVFRRSEIMRNHGSWGVLPRS